jgi:hypothetical protein
LLSAIAVLGAVDAQAEGCPTAKDGIATDRPDVEKGSKRRLALAPYLPGPLARTTKI